MVTLRPVRVADAAALGMPARVFRRDGQDRDLRRAARYAAEVDGDLAGLVTLHSIRADEAECGVFVLPQHRRRGVATAALRQLVERAAPRRVRFTTTRDNVAARRLAARVGLEATWA